MGFSRDVHVRFSDCDGLRHVNNAVYLTYIEDARIAFLLSLTTDDGGSFVGRGLMVARTEVDYIKPVLFGRGPVVVTVEVLAVGRSSFRLGYLLTQDGSEVARSVTVMVAYDHKAARSRPLEPVERAALEAQLALTSY